MYIKDARLKLIVVINIAVFFVIKENQVIYTDLFF